MALDSSRHTRRFPPALRALEHRNFQLYFAGQTVSILGTWIQQVALSWLIFRLTGSSTLLGIVAFCSLAPQLIIGPLAGAWIDKQDKRKWLIGIQTLMAIQAFLLAILGWTALITPNLIISMALLLGMLNSFDSPLRQSLISNFIGHKDDLPNALALNGMLFNTGRFIGPPIAGLLVGLTSEPFCFALNGFSFLAMISAIHRVRSTPPVRATGSIGDVFRQGLQYAWQTKGVRLLIFIVSILNITASSYAVLLPVFAQNVFQGDSMTLGWLWGAAGSGALIATLFLATRNTTTSVFSGVLGGTGISACALLTFSTTSWLPLGLISMAALGLGLSICNIGINTLLQSTTPEQYRGRIVSFFTATRFGFDAVGGLLAGAIATYIGAGRTLQISGFMLLIFAVLLIYHRQTAMKCIFTPTLH